MFEQAMQMIEGLEVPGNRLRTALLLIPPSQLGRVGDIAARLLADVEDIAQMALQAAPKGSRYVDLSASCIGKWLDTISQKTTGQRRVLVVNLDLLLAALSESERTEVWSYLRTSMPHRPRTLIVVMPEGADLLLPRVEDWETAGRCVRL